MERLSAAIADRYKIDRELGAGGMATVYLAHDVKHDRNVALKVLRPELAAVIGADRFLAEIKTTANLQHPHILPLHDSGEVDGTVFYVMPFVEGESLRDRLDREKQLPIADALRIATEVAAALDYAHRKDIIHRDIKPENILLHDGQALVADFGIALAASSAGGTRMTETGMSLGTPHYMSPEQAMGERDLDARSDVYALGATLYEMLTGEPPFTGPTAQAIVAKVLASEPEPVRTLRKTVPDHVAVAVHAALQKLPADRFSDAAAFADALAHAGAGPLATFGDGSVQSRAIEVPFWRRPAIAWGVAGLLAIVTLMLAFRSAERSLFPLTTRLSVVLPPGTPLVGENQVALSRNGRTLALTAEVDGVKHVLMRNLDEDSVYIVPETQGVTGNVAFSADSRWLAFSTDGTLYKTPVAGGARIALSRAAWGHLAWLGSEAVIYTPDYDDGLWRVSAEGRDTTELTRPEREQGRLGHWWPQVLPDGDHVLFTNFTTPADRSWLEVLSLESGKRTVIQEGGYFGRYADGYLFFMRGSAIMAVLFDLRRMETAGTPAPVLQDVLFTPTSGSAAFALGGDGTLAYLKAGSADRAIRWIDDAGVERPAVDSAARYREAVPSPDGTQLAVVRDGDVWTFDLSRRFFTRLTNSEQIENWLIWTPDSREVVYRRDVPQFDVFKRVANASAPEELVITSSRDKRPGGLSPDGLYLLYDEHRDLKVAKFSPSSDDTAATFLGGPGAQRVGGFSPDGDWIAYQSNESGRDEVYLVPFPLDRGPRRERVSLDGGENPQWAPDGRAIYYQRSRQIFRAPVDLATGTVGRAEALPRIEGLVSWHVAPNGSLLVVKTVDESAPRSVSVVLNWMATLSRGDGS